jgi:DNA invertase Pin-like site-specific DNA recombinase
VKLSGKETEIQTLLRQHLSKSKIAKILHVHRFTLYRFIKEKNIK